MSTNTDIARAIAEAVVQAAQYANRDANEYSKSAIKNTKISGNQIRQNSIPGYMFKDGSIPFAKVQELSAQVAQIALAQIAVADIDFAQIKNVVIDNAHISNAGIDYAKIKDLDAQSAYFGSQIFELGVGDSLYMGRLRVNAANIAHLEVGELILEDADGNLYKIGVDEHGNVVTSLYEVQYQNIGETAKNLMSQYTIYRGDTPPSTPYVGQLWVNTATDIISRCVAVLPDVIWEPIKANELHTSYINAVERGLEILTTGVIDVKSGGSINIDSGADINVDSMGSINIEAGGNINLQSADDIKIEGTRLVEIVAEDVVITASNSIVETVRGSPLYLGDLETIETNVTSLIGHRVEIISTSDILSDAIQSTTLSAKVWHGSQDVTDTIPSSLFKWRRVSADSTGDNNWNNAHQGMKSITLTVQDVLFSATYFCDLYE